MSLYHSRIDILDREINNVQHQLEALPEGELSVRRNASRYKWFIRQPGSFPEYLPKHQKELAEKLAVKKYLQIRLNELQSEKEWLSQLVALQGAQRESEKLLTDTRYSKLLESHFRTGSEITRLWQEKTYTPNPEHPEKLIHKTSSGYCVRSKSEAMIEMALTQYQIPHRYEYPLQLGTHTIYPDFTILHPQTFQVFYWEHFGMMDDSHYRKHNSVRVEEYARQGIYPSIQLIMTFETTTNPLSPNDISNAIQHYFL